MVVSLLEEIIDHQKELPGDKNQLYDICCLPFLQRNLFFRESNSHFGDIDHKFPACPAFGF